MSGPQITLLADGRRLHLRHGPIDIVAEAFGDAREVAGARNQAGARFATVLEELVAELPQLRTPIGDVRPLLRGAVARRMARAVWPHRGAFVTPMAAVAGAVADEVLAAMTAGRRLDRAYVNNGGDIAVQLAPGERLRTGIVDDAHAPRIDARLELTAALPARGLATSGWRGRSHSLGIADAVTVLARTAAEADVAATLLANAVDTDDPRIARVPACALADDTDLGDRLVTTGVPPLSPAQIATALDRGHARAAAMRAAGLIEGIYLALQGAVRVLEPEPARLSGAAE